MKQQQAAADSPSDKTVVKASRKVVWATPIDILESDVIVIPEIAKKRATRGKVVSVGIDVDGVQVGDEIVFTMYAATEVKVDEVTYLVLKGEDVLGVVK